MTAHPAKYSKPVLEAIDKFLPQTGRILDPFAGTGLISKLATDTREIVGVEIEPEWAAMDPCTIVGDATALPFPDGHFAAVATSPAFGNRMADKHNARDDSDRNTYKHKLGRDLHPNNSGGMRWGPEYRSLHLDAWREAYRVTANFGCLILNIKDHFKTRTVSGIKTKDRQAVSFWHANALGRVGWTLDQVAEIHSRGNRFGANRDERAETEYVMRFVKAEPVSHGIVIPAGTVKVGDTFRFDGSNVKHIAAMIPMSRDVIEDSEGFQEAAEADARAIIERP